MSNEKIRNQFPKAGKDFKQQERKLRTENDKTGMSAERRAEQAEKLKKLHDQRNKLAVQFKPGDKVEIYGRIGIVGEQTIPDRKLGRIPVKFGRGKVEGCNPQYLKKVEEGKE